MIVVWKAMIKTALHDSRIHRIIMIIIIIIKIIIIIICFNNLFKNIKPTPFTRINTNKKM